MMDANEVFKKFQEYDRDKNGYVTAKEAQKILQRELGFTPESTRKLVQQYDKNDDGRLSYEEFIWFYWRIHDKKAELITNFKKMDIDNSNSISFQEAKQILKNFEFNEMEIRDLFAIHDTNGDGVLQFDEFLQFWQSVEKKKL